MERLLREEVERTKEGAQAMDKPYILEIYEPGSGSNVWVLFESPQAFGSIREGDIINPGLWRHSHSPMRVLRVVGIEHAIWEIDGVAKHKIMVYTKELKSEDQARRLKALWETDI